MVLSLHVAAWAAWAPGVEDKDAWADWAAGGREIGISAANPPLGHLDGMFKRRLGQLSRMVLQVGHELAPGQEIPVAFASRWGEIAQQYKIARNLIESGEVAPAAFSLSVFNTPAALLSIAEKNHQRGSALYGGASSFALALLEAAALLRSGEPRVLLLVGDELVPEAWQALLPARVPPHAVGLLLGAAAAPASVTLEIETTGGLTAASPAGAPRDGAAALPPPLRFLRWFLTGCPGRLELTDGGFVLTLRGR
jgi:hypothetical protein